MADSRPKSGAKRDNFDLLTRFFASKVVENKRFIDLVSLVTLVPFWRDQGPRVWVQG